MPTPAKKIAKTDKERTRESIDNLIAQGGARMTFNLSPDARKALLFGMKKCGYTQKTAYINDLLLEEQIRIKRKGK